jgi:hypothetical protein
MTVQIRKLNWEECFFLGYHPVTGAPLGVPKSERIHTLVTGEPGMGKSTLLFHWIMHNIYLGEGVALLDPHGDLAEKVLSFIPSERYKDVIYINPETALKRGRVVQINPFESREIWEQTQKKHMFMDCLHRLYPEAWGYRLQEILSYAIDACYEAIPGFNLPELSKFVRDDGYRAETLKRVSNPMTLTFWRHSWPRMREEWISAVESKLTYFEEDMLRPTFSSPTSSFSFRQIMDEGKIAIIYLPEGTWGHDVVNFIGSLFLTWFYLAGMSRVDTPEEKRRPFYIYVDEAHRFITESLRDLLQALRKYKVYLTLAVQNLQQFPKEFQADIPQLCSTKVVFKGGEENAELLAPYFGTTKEVLLKLPKHHYMVCTSYGGRDTVQTLMTKPIPPPLHDPEEVIRVSLETWARPVMVEKGKPEETGLRARIPTPEMEPVQYFTLCRMACLSPEESSMGVVSEGWLTDKLREEYKWDPAVISYAIKNLTMRGLLEIQYLKRDAAGRQTKEPRPFLVLSKGGWAELYPELKGPREGGAVHAALLGQTMRWAWGGGMCPVLCGKEEKTSVVLPTGTITEVELFPDMVIYPPDVEAGKPSFRYWDSSRRFAVEVEVYPEKHPDRVIAHYLHMKAVGLGVLFVCRPESEEGLKEILRKGGAVLVDLDEFIEKPEPGKAAVKSFPLQLPPDSYGRLWLESWARRFDPEYPKSLGIETSVAETPVLSKTPSIEALPSEVLRAEQPPREETVEEIPKEKEEAPPLQESVPRKGGRREGAGRKVSLAEIRRRIAKVRKAAVEFRVWLVKGKESVFAVVKDEEGKTKKVYICPYSAEVRDLLKTYGFRLKRASS